jgi:hypothetical protein
MRTTSKRPVEQRRLFVGLTDDGLWTRVTAEARQECEQLLARLLRVVVHSERAAVPGNANREKEA